MIIIPHEGLGNRIRVMLAALQWSRDTGCKVHFLWIREKNLNCRVDRIFKPIPHLTELPPIWRRGWHFLLRFKRIIEYLGGVKIFNDGDYKEFSNYVSERKYSWLTLCSSMSRFYTGNCPKAHDVFVLQPWIETKVREITQHFNDKTIGIHIRRTDNAEAIKNSPIQSFFEKIDAEIELNSSFNFYLASDDTTVLEEMQQRYGQRVIVSNGLISRDSETGIQHAVVELFALSRCSRIWGSYWSSFSQLAAEVGDIPLEVICRKQ